jgi:hypothetical protein
MKESNHLIIIGSMRSGTTSLYRHLSKHSKICPSTKKEPEFFTKNQGHEVSAEKYEELWDCEDSSQKYKMEASTGYTKYPIEKGVPERIKEYGIQPKFIYIVRNPIDRMISQYNFMNISLGYNLDGFYEEEIVELSKYYKQLNEFRKVFGESSRYLIVDFENLVDNPKKVLKRCSEFIGVKYEWSFQNQKALNKTPNRKLELWISQLGTFENILGRLLTEGQWTRLKRFLGWFTPRVDRREMTPSERSEAHEMLWTDMKKFEKEFGFNVSKWGF